jgi:NADPH:quinone reductase-like Zn-dependent oxidoreductase
MSRIVLTAVGDLDRGIHLEDTAASTPVLGPGDVLVAMEAAPLNNADFLLAQGWYGVQPALPAALGSEGVGRVLEVGPEVSAELVGRRVMILPTYDQGSWADRVVASERSVVVVPDDVDPLQLAMLPINGATAALMLRRYVDLRPGDWVVQSLGTSAVARHVVALAQRAGVRVASVVRRPEAVAELQAAGDDLVLLDGEDVGERLVAALGGRHARLALEGAGGGMAGRLAQALELHGTLVTYSSATGEPPLLGLADLVYQELALHGFWLINWVWNAPRDEIRETYAELVGLLADGTLHADVEATYAIEDHRAAFAHAQRSGRAGKVLFTFDTNNQEG